MYLNIGLPVSRALSRLFVFLPLANSYSCAGGALFTQPPNTMPHSAWNSPPWSSLMPVLMMSPDLIFAEEDPMRLRE